MDRGTVPGQGAQGALRRDGGPCSGSGQREAAHLGIERRRGGAVSRNAAPKPGAAPVGPGSGRAHRGFGRRFSPSGARERDIPRVAADAAEPGVPAGGFAGSGCVLSGPRALTGRHAPGLCRSAARRAARPLRPASRSPRGDRDPGHGGGSQPLFLAGRRMGRLRGRGKAQEGLALRRAALDALRCDAASWSQLGLRRHDPLFTFGRRGPLTGLRQGRRTQAADDAEPRKRRIDPPLAGHPSGGQDCPFHHSRPDRRLRKRSNRSHFARDGRAADRLGGWDTSTVRALRAHPVRARQVCLRGSLRREATGSDRFCGDRPRRSFRIRFGGFRQLRGLENGLARLRAERPTHLAEGSRLAGSKGEHAPPDGSPPFLHPTAPLPRRPPPRGGRLWWNDLDLRSDAGRVGAVDIQWYQLPSGLVARQ